MKESTYKSNKKNFKRSEKGGEFETVAVNDKQSNFSHIQAVIAKPIEVMVYNNALDKAIRAFRALVQKERVLSLYKEKQVYEKPSDRKRRKKNESLRKVYELNNKSSFRKNKDHSDFE